MQFLGPTLGPDPGGESWDHYQNRVNEMIEELLHKHPPHIETEPPVITPGPGTL